MSLSSNQKPETRNWERKTFILVSGFCLLVTACGFHPLYGEHTAGPGANFTAGIKVDSVPGRSGQLFTADLEDLLNPGNDIIAKPAYRMSANLTSAVSPIGVARDGTVSRYNVYLTSHYTIYRLADGKSVLSGNIRHVSSYNNAINAYFSTYISEQDAEKRGVAELAEIYRNRLAAWLDAGAPEQKAAASAAAAAPATGFAPEVGSASNPWQPQPWQAGGVPAPKL